MNFRPFIDIGHGGPNKGTHDAEFVEKDMVLDIGDRLHPSMRAAPFYVGRSRIADVEMSQHERGEASLLYRSTFVASIHVNDCPDPRVGGAQLYVGEHNQRTLRLANELIPMWARLFGSCQAIKAFKPADPDEPGISEEERQKRLGDRWIERPRSIILAHTADVILFELGFRRNEHDRAILMSELGREEIASLLRWSIFRAAQFYGSLSWNRYSTRSY